MPKNVDHEKRRAQLAETGSTLVAEEGLRSVHDAAAARMLAIISSTSSPRAQLEAVLRESLPLKTASFREWRVWLAFWGAVPSSAALAAEHKLRYAEWRQLLLVLVKNACGAEEQTVVTRLMALVDGFGLQIAMCTSPRTAEARVLHEECLLALGEVLDAAGIAD